MSKCLAQGIVHSKYEINATCYCCKSNYKYHEYYKRVSTRSHGKIKLELILSGGLRIVGIS